ncbi:MAG: DUF4493 domain-containing protein [Muribaculaceae bacterium]|nr:DUF4493 domain-containing protein [Muribaculaceae bacterium]
MKRSEYIFTILALAAGFSSCSSELPFSEDKPEGKGRLLSSAIAVELKTDERLVRATNAPDVNDFTVEFLNASDQTVPVESYRYGEMPEVVTLPVGDYVARAYYGGTYGAAGSTAAFSAPYYNGTSAQFSIEENRITDNIGTVECALSNVKVTILFDESLANVMSPDSKVTVKVGGSGELVFTKDTDESGYFHYDAGSTTISTVFSGVVDGDDTTESKSYSNVQPGNHYRITFKLHSVDPNEPGEINPGDPGDEIKIDATVQLEDLTGGDGINLGDPSDNDIYMDDDRYPDEGGEEPGPDDPGNDPENPDVPGSGPTVTAEEPINLDDWNIAEEGLKCVLNVHSDTGLTGFTVEIDSPTLTEDILTDVSLAAKFDLISGLTETGEDIEEGLRGLHLPVKDEVKDQNDVIFDVSDFMGLLGIYGAADHKFILTVKDASGTTVIELKLRTI